MTLENTTLVKDARNEYVSIDVDGGTEIVRLSAVIKETELLPWFKNDGWDMDTLTFGELKDIRCDRFESALFAESEFSKSI